MTLESLVTRTSFLRKNPASWPTNPWCNRPSECTTKRRASSRGVFGRSAMRDSGSVKSKRETSMGGALYRCTAPAPEAGTGWIQFGKKSILVSAGATTDKLIALTLKDSFVPLIAPTRMFPPAGATITRVCARPVRAARSRVVSGGAKESEGRPAGNLGRCSRLTASCSEWEFL